jgi:hypothetical protein
VFPDGCSYTMMKNGKGWTMALFQQLGVLSRTAETNKQSEQQADEINRQLSGVK